MSEYRPHVRSTVVSKRVFFTGEDPYPCPECGVPLDFDTAEEAYREAAADMFIERFDERHEKGWQHAKGSVSKPLWKRFHAAVPRLARFLAFVDQRNGVVHQANFPEGSE